MKATKLHHLFLSQHAHTALSHPNELPFFLRIMTDRKAPRSSRSTATLEESSEEHSLWKQICTSLANLEDTQERSALVLEKINAITRSTDFNRGEFWPGARLCYSRRRKYRLGDIHPTCAPLFFHGRYLRLFEAAARHSLPGSHQTSGQRDTVS